MWRATVLGIGRLVPGCVSEGAVELGVQAGCAGAGLFRADLASRGESLVRRRSFPPPDAGGGGELDRRGEREPRNVVFGVVLHDNHPQSFQAVGEGRTST